MARSSLTEAAESSAPASSGSTMDTKKMAIVGVCVVAILGSVVFLLFSMGIIGGSEPPPPTPYVETLTPEEKVEFEKMQREREKLEKIYPPSGA